jgi:hypothetical protein
MLIPGNTGIFDVLDFEFKGLLSTFCGGVAGGTGM